MLCFPILEMPQALAAQAADGAARRRHGVALGRLRKGQGKR